MAFVKEPKSTKNYNMKKQILALASIVMIAGAVTFTSCKQEDITAPVITITGGNSQSQNLPSTAGAGTWTNPSATATDDEDGDLSTSISVSGTVDPNAAGTYTLTYTVSDAAGNSATEVVTVTIANSAAYLGGSYTNAGYSCQISGSGTFNATISASSTTNGLISINNFGAFGTSINISMTATGSSISIPAQPVGTQGNILNGSGTITGSSPAAFTLSYTWTDGSSTESCNDTYTHD